MIISLIVLLATISLILLALGIFGKLKSNNRAYSTLILASGIMFLVLSLIILGEGIEIATGTSLITISI